MADPRLYGELVASIVRYTVDRFEHPQPPRTARPGEPEPLRALAGARFSGQALNAFERACVLLRQLGLAHPVDKDGKPVGDESNPYLYAGFFRLAVDGRKIAAVVRERAADDSAGMPPVDEILATWLDCAVHSGLSTRREPFVPHDDLRDVMRELMLAGYIAQRGERVVWTDAIGPVMQSNCYWDAENRSFEKIYERDEDADLRAAVATIPDKVRRAALNKDEFTVYVALCNLWVDGAWKDTIEPGAPIEMYGGFDRAERFIALVVESSGKDR